MIEAEDGRLIASAPDRLSGLMEIRGIGIVPVAAKQRAVLRLAVYLKDLSEVERLPQQERYQILETSIPAMSLNAFEPSAPLKLALALSSTK
jgi:serine kinase of HPr protein (carbohydrate metabolism regulator)